MSVIDLSKTLGGALLTMDGKNPKPIENQKLTISSVEGKYILFSWGMYRSKYLFAGNTFSLNGSVVSGNITQVVTALDDINSASLNTTTSTAWGDITGTLSAQADLNSALAAKTFNLNETSIKTGAYAAAANDLVKTDTTGGVVPITFPAGLPDKTRIAVKMITQGGTNATTITLSGADVFNKAGGATTASILLLNQTITFQYKSGIWTAISSDVPLSQLDLRFGSLIGNPALLSTNSKTSLQTALEEVKQLARVMKPDWIKVYEKRSRRPNVYWSYAGTVRMCGVGQTYTTITAAYAACVDGDIIQCIDGTYLTSAESGAYLMFNAVKRVLIRGNATNRGAVIISDNAANTYGVRLRNCDQLTFQNLTITSNQPHQTVLVNMATAINKYVFDNCVIENTSTSAIRTVLLQGQSLFDGYHEFKGCTITEANNIAASSIGWDIVVTDANHTAHPNPILITNSTIGNTYLNESATDFYMYDSSVVQTRFSSSYLLGIGADGSVPLATTSYFDIRNCNLSYGVAGLGGHGVLIGRGLAKVYFVNNVITMPPSLNSLAIGLVLKCVAANLGDIIIEGNYIEAPRTIYLKGCQKNQINYNCTKSNWGDTTSGYGLEMNNPNNPDGPIETINNVITYNTLIGHMKAMRFLTATGAVSMQTSNQSNTVNNNRYKIDNSVYVAGNTAYIESDATNVGWSNRASYWSQDADSEFITPFNF